MAETFSQGEKFYLKTMQFRTRKMNNISNEDLPVSQNLVLSGFNIFHISAKGWRDALFTVTHFIRAGQHQTAT